MENFDKVIRKKSLVGSIARAYSVTGNSRVFANTERLFDDELNNAGTIDAIGQTADVFFEVFFDQPINNIIKFELIRSTVLDGEEESSSPSSYIQYLPTSNTSITSSTPLTDISEGDSLYSEYINIIDVNGNSNIPFPYEPLPESPTQHRRLLTTLPYKINAKSIRYRFTQRSSGTFIYINEFRIFTIDGVYSFEFNDSVLTTKAWNSSRYSGRQLQASAINEFTSGDTTYGKTPVIQNYSRNIYLGSRVVGMNSSSIDDGTLTHFEGFSYVTMHEFLTINDDLSITRHSIRGNDKKNTKKKRFYRSFYHDFPINSEAEIKLFDETINDNLKSSYNIFNNSGQLQKILLIGRHDTDNTGSGYGVRYSGSNQLFYATSSTQNDLGAGFTIYNQQLIIDKFFTGSLISTPPAWVGGSNPSGGPANL